MSVGDDAQIVLMAIPSEEHDALRAMVRVLRYLAASEGYFTEDDLFTLWTKEKDVNEHLSACLSEHHAVGALDGVLIGDDCPICAEADHD